MWPFDKAYHLLHVLPSEHDRNTSGAGTAPSQLHPKCSLLPFPSGLSTGRAPLALRFCWGRVFPTRSWGNTVEKLHTSRFPFRNILIEEAHFLANKHERSVGFYLNHTLKEAAISLKLFTPIGQALCKSKENKGKLVSTSEHLRMLKHFWTHLYQACFYCHATVVTILAFQTIKPEIKHYTVIN